jgi:hypothetical protein
MAECGDTAKKRGAKSGGTKSGRKTRAVPVEKEEPHGAAGTVRKGRRNEMIQAEWLSGRDPESLAKEHDLKRRRVYEIVKDCREGMIAGLALGEPGRARVLREELLLQKFRAVSDAREIELRAREKANTSVELGAYNARIRALRDLTMFLRETGLLESEDEQPPAVSEAQLNDEFDFAWKRWGEMAKLGRDEERKYWERRAAEVKMKRDAEYPLTREQLMAHSDGEEDDSLPQS